MTGKLVYPALYESASEGSASAQRAYFWTIRAEYALLFLVAFISTTRGLWSFGEFLISFLLVILAGLFVFKIWNKLDQNWYRCRALAESIKTSTWRFSMRAHPFGDAESVNIPKANLRNVLRDILKSNQFIAEHLLANSSEQFTDTMLSVRRLPVDERLAFYIQNRIDDQRGWYSRKSNENLRAQRRWVIITIALYIAAAISINGARLGFPSLAFGFDPLIVLVTSAIGWLQIKRHGELTASYNLTAHEIGIIRSNSDGVKTEEQLSEFVNEAELAFSREHTQWVARRDAA